MPVLADILSTGNRVKRNLRDLISNPQAVGEQWSDQLRQDIPQMMLDPSQYFGGGVGRTDLLGRATSELRGSAPTQASLAGQLHSLGITGKQGTRDLYNMQGADPELLQLIEQEAIRKGRGYGI